MKVEQSKPGLKGAVDPSPQEFASNCCIAQVRYAAEPNERKKARWFLILTQVQRISKMGKDTFYRMVTGGEIPGAFRIGKCSYKRQSISRDHRAAQRQQMRR